MKRAHVEAASVRNRASFRFIRYACVWEDADLLCEALAPVAAGGRLLSIASAGDNALALLTLDPAEVLAVDRNPAQLACLALRIAAFHRLPYADLLVFLGALPGRNRGRTYARLRSDLPEAARDYWDARPALVAGGILHAGRFERYLRAFREWVLPLIHSQRTIQQLRKERSREEREGFYRERWDSRRWRLAFRLFFSRTVMSRSGRDAAFFAHAE